jgi:hypothetical protein
MGGLAPQLIAYIDLQGDDFYPLEVPNSNAEIEIGIEIQIVG